MRRDLVVSERYDLVILGGGCSGIHLVVMLCAKIYIIRHGSALIVEFLSSYVDSFCHLI